MAVGDTYFESDGQAVTVSIDYAVEAREIVVAEGMVGIAVTNGESGDDVALDIRRAEFQFYVPTALAVTKGELVYLTVATITGHTPDDAAYTKSAGAGKVLLFKATSDQDANDVVTGIFLAGLAAS